MQFNCFPICLQQNSYNFIKSNRKIVFIDFIIIKSIDREKGEQYNVVNEFP